MHTRVDTNTVAVPFACLYHLAYVAMASEDEDERFYDAQASGDETLGGRVEADMTCMDAVPASHAAQLNQPPSLSIVKSQTATDNTRPRPSTSDGSESAAPQHRHSLQEIVPAIPAIPARFLDNGRPASVLGSRSERARRRQSREADIVPAPALRVERPRTSAGRSSGNAQSAISPKSASQASHNSINGVTDIRRVSTEQNNSILQLRDNARRKSLSAIPHVHRRTLALLETSGKGSNDEEQEMTRQGRGREADLFLELAQDGDGGEGRVQNRSDRVASRLSHSGKRRSLPAESILTSSADRRPKSSGSILAGRPSSRLGAFPSDLQRHVDRYRGTPSRATFDKDDAVSVSGRSVSGRAQRYSDVPERPPLSPSRLGQRMRSPDLPSFGRRRPSFGAGQAQAQKARQSQLPSNTHGSQDESPADSSEPKRSLPDSASVDSDTADTVWDELDELKSRIRNLERTGKLPPSSGAPVSGDSSERPRTATTAPTTIDSSPKHERKPEPESRPAPAGNLVGGPNVANIHPLLHAALAKAKPLLSATLYRSLEATASDALQLAAMTGSAGPQGTAFSAASIINGVTVSDRHVRRKADTMCRNLTDLCLALCEGKHEAPSVTASPITLEPVKSSPSMRYSRSSIGPGDRISQAPNRPMSRLEARRTSILGLQSTSSRDNSPRGISDDRSASEQEGTPSQQRTQDPPRELRRTSRPSSRLLSARMPRYEEVSGDEDPTVRPPSRAMTDIGGRNKLGGQREYNSPGQNQNSSPSLRNSLATRRVNSSAYESNRELSRVASLSSDAGGRRRWAKESTPPVLEEEGNDGSDYQPSSQPRRRITSLGQFSTRRAAEVPNRATSLSVRRPHVVVE